MGKEPSRIAALLPRCIARLDHRAVRIPSLLVQRLSPRLERNFFGFQVLRDVSDVPCPRLPNSRYFGFTSALFGAGTVRFGLPSGRRGIPVMGYLIHCGDGDAN